MGILRFFSIRILAQLLHTCSNVHSLRTVRSVHKRLLNKTIYNLAGTRFVSDSFLHKTIFELDLSSTPNLTKYIFLK